MTPQEEFNLFRTDYPAWCKYVAPRWLVKMRESEAEKKRLWAVAGAELRAEIRRLVEAER